MEKKTFTVALAGNPNTGKTTIFNLLTGSNQKTGNWPGVTVKRIEGTLHYEDCEFRVVDTPGTYSLYFADSVDQKVARDFLLGGDYDVVVLVIDSTNMERNLYLFVQLAEAGKNVVLALNMMDEAERQGLIINADELEKVSGARVVKMVASKGIGTDELKRKIFMAVKNPASPKFPNYGVLSDFVFKIAELVKDVGFYPPTALAFALIEGDYDFWNSLGEHPNIEKVKKLISQLKYETGVEPELLVTEKRYAYIHGLVKEIVSVRKGLSKRIDITDKIDRVITKWWVGIPLFLFTLYGIFEFIFGVGNPVAELLNSGFDWLSEFLRSWFSSIGVSKWFTSLVADGIIPGVGSVLVFVPNIFILFFSFALLEDSGFLSRFAFVFDRFMHLFGLHGKSFIPMVLGFGCNVPAVLGTRILETAKDRILTMLVIPLMSCSARLPVYLLFAGVFFPNSSGLVVFSLYMVGVLFATVVARFFKRVAFKGEYAPLIMELPPYRFPVMRMVMKNSLFNTWLFVKKAGTVIFVGVVLVWTLSFLPYGVEYGSKESFIGQIGSFLAPVFSPAGFGFWQASVALLSGLVAKELVVGTMGALFGGEANLASSLQSLFSPVSAYAFLLMVLLYFPCIATMSAIKQEAGWKWALITVAYTLVLGWLAAVVFYQVASAVF